MNLIFTNTKRKPKWPKWAIMYIIVWGILIITSLMLSKFLNKQIDLCLFKKLTTLPCPACGATRGTLEILQGNIMTGFLFNPLLFIIITLLLFHLLMKYALKKSVTIIVSKNEKKVIWISFFIIFFTNWYYVTTL